MLHDKSVSLGAASYDVTGLLLFERMTMFRNVYTVHRLLSCNNALPYLPPVLAEAGSSQRVTRSKSGRHFSLPKNILTASEGCFYYSAAKQWNDSPHTITCIDSSYVFFKSVQKHMLSDFKN